MMALGDRRRFYAEEIQTTANLSGSLLVEALASVPREQFLRPGPWTIRSEADLQGAPRQTPDADPRHLYHNVAVAIDPARQLFNGAPGLLAMVIDRLALAPGNRVVHIGCGTGYYTALMAHCVGPSGSVLAIEVDPGLAGEARANLASMPWVDVRTGDGRAVSDIADGNTAGTRVNAILVNAGVTHPLDSWLDALAPAGRIAVPLTVAMAPTIGKGLMILATRGTDPAAFDARVIGFVAIYNAIGLRDDATGQQVGAAMQKQPFPPLTRLRRDLHDLSPSCWLHREGACWSVG
jgi:protein-L-isoaspartate(D-aspartate) O-methyltransferase